MFLVGVRMVAHLFHATDLKKEETPISFVLLNYSLCMGNLVNLGLHIVLEKISGNDLDLSLLDNFVVFLEALP